MHITLNIFFAIAAVILFLVGFQVWGELVGAQRAIVFALAFWQTGLALGLPVIGLGNRPTST